MQKLGTPWHEKQQTNTGIIPNPKSLHILAKSLQSDAPAEGAGSFGATVEEVVVAFGWHLQEDDKSAKTVESYVGDVAGFLAYLVAKGADIGSGLRRFT